jgi:hypothetical protein
MQTEPMLLPHRWFRRSIALADARRQVTPSVDEPTTLDALVFSKDNRIPHSALFPQHHWVRLRNLYVQSSTAVSHQENKVQLFGPEQDVNADSVISQTEHRTPFFGLKSRSTHPSMAAMAVTMNAGTTRVGMNV